VHTIVTAPGESWQSVVVTAGAAASLILDPTAHAVQASTDESNNREEAGGHGQGGPVGRAKVRWKEAQNEMPEVRSDQACSRECVPILEGCRILLTWAVGNAEEIGGLLVQGAWGKIQWAWDLPPVKKLRITITAVSRLPHIHRHLPSTCMP
jgi:hypothetical protein